METAYEKIRTGLELVDSYIWHPFFMVSILVLTGLYLTVRFLLPQLRFFGHALGLVAGKYDSPGDKGEVSHFQALSAALSATVGIGNIAGVATAIHLGGPGATFWLWVSGFLGMATKMAECSLAVKYRKIDPDGTVSGGPMYTIKNGLKKRWKPLAYLFASFCAISAAFGAGNMVQSNTIAVQINDMFGIPRWLVGIVVSVLVAFVILGGIKRIAKVASILVPFMALMYCTAALIVLGYNVKDIPAAFSLIFDSAFSGSAAVGGFIGVGVKEVIRFGIARGTFSNEAGQGSAAIAHSAARSDPPIREGFVALLEPFIDTLVVCTMTALVIITSGVWKEKTKGEIDLVAVKIFAQTPQTPADVEDGSRLLTSLINVKDGLLEGGVIFFHERSIIESSKFYLDDKPFSGSLQVKEGKAVAGTIYVLGKGEGVGGRDMPRHVTATKEQIGRLKMTGYFCQTGAVLSGLAFSSKLGLLGKILVTLAVLLFGYSTSISWSYYGDRAIEFLLGRRAVFPYRILFVILNFCGALITLNIVWTLADICNALMIIPNLVSIWLLAGVVQDMIRKYNIEAQKASAGALVDRDSDVYRKKKK
ncbi:MAG: sodium:alanine symporter family protein [Pseudomonadota bacterium]